MKSFVQNEFLVIVNGEASLSLEEFINLMPTYKLHESYSSVEYIAKDKLIYVEGNTPIDMSIELDDDIMWPLGEQAISLVLSRPIKEKTEAIEPYIPVSTDLAHFMTLSKKDRKKMLESMPLLDDKEIFKDLLKRARNSLLIRSDWAVMPDYPFTEEQRAPWIAYRQELRDYMQLVKDKEIIDTPDLPKAPK
jgi:hypothetical protein